MKAFKQMLMRRVISSWIIFSFMTSVIVPPQVCAQALQLPELGAMVLASPAYKIGRAHV